MSFTQCMSDGRTQPDGNLFAAAGVCVNGDQGTSNTFRFSIYYMIYLRS